MNAPLIGITTYHRNEAGLVQLPAVYGDAVRRAGGIPLLLQPSEPQLEALLARLDGLILSGGGDVDPQRYTSGEHPEVYWVDAERDDFEFALVERALGEEMPLFCICRGFQVLNVALGGTLMPDIATARPDAHPHRQEGAETYGDYMLHEVDVSPTSTLAEVMGSDRVKTASWHHQGVAQIAPGLEVVARAADGIAEGLALPGADWLTAVQWHPELTAADDPTQQRLFDDLVVNARRYRRGR